MTEGKAKDLILEYILTDTERFFNAGDIQQNLFDHNEIGEIEVLLSRISESYDEVAHVSKGTYGHTIMANDLTKVFLNKGGFVKIENETNEKNRILAEKESFEIEKSKVDFELAKKMLKEYPKTKWFSRIGFFIGVVLALKELYIWLMKLLSQ